MTDHIASGKCILTNVGITLENKTLLRKSNVPEDDGNREECNEIEEAIMDPSSMDMNSSPWRHVSTNGVTAYDDTTGYNGSETPGHQPETLQGPYFPKMKHVLKVTVSLNIIRWCKHYIFINLASIYLV